MRGAAVEKDHLLTFELDRDRGNLAHGPGTDAFGTQLIELARVRKDAQVKLGGFFGVVIEPEEWRKFVHSWHGSSQEGGFRLRFPGVVDLHLGGVTNQRLWEQNCCERDVTKLRGTANLRGER